MAGITFTVGSGLADAGFGLVQGPIKMLIKKQAEPFEAASIRKKVFREVKSTHALENYRQMGSMNGPKPVAENGAYPSTDWAETFDKSLRNVTWKNRFSISREAIEDDQVLELQTKPAAFTTAHYRTEEEFGAAIYAGAMQGKTSIDFEGRKFDIACADGKALFHAAHPAHAHGSFKKTQCNMFANEFSNKALVAAETEMQLFRDDNGKLLSVRPDTILIPNDAVMKYKVLEAIGAEKDPETSVNGFNMNFGRWNVIGWSYLNQFLEDGFAPWVLLDSNLIQNGVTALWQNRVGFSCHSFYDNDTDANVWNDRSRFNAGFADWRFASIGGVTGGQELKLA